MADTTTPPSVATQATDGGWALPTPEAVAALLRARTKVESGDELGAWTADTRPTLVEVNALIALAAQELALCVGDWLPPEYVPGGQALVVLKTCMLIELSYYPEQVDPEQSPYARLAELYVRDAEAFCPAVASYRPVPPDPDPTGAGLLPAWYYGDGDAGCAGGWYDPVTQTWVYPQTTVYPSGRPGSERRITDERQRRGSGP